VQEIIDIYLQSSTIWKNSKIGQATLSRVNEAAEYVFASEGYDYKHP
jgi:hypothetical protein